MRPINFQRLAEGCKTWDEIVEALENCRDYALKLKGNGYVIKEVDADNCVWYEKSEERVVADNERRLAKKMKKGILVGKV